MMAQRGPKRGFVSSSVNACGGPGTKVQVDTLGPGTPFTDDGPKGPKPRLCLIIRERLRRLRDKGAGRRVASQNAIHG